MTVVRWKSTCGLGDGSGLYSFQPGDRSGLVNVTRPDDPSAGTTVMKVAANDTRIIVGSLPFSSPFGAVESCQVAFDCSKVELAAVTCLSSMRNRSTCVGTLECASAQCGADPSASPSPVPPYSPDPNAPSPSPVPTDSPSFSPAPAPSPSPSPAPLPTPNMTCLPVFGTYEFFSMANTDASYLATVVVGPGNNSSFLNFTFIEKTGNITVPAPYNATTRVSTRIFNGDLTFSCFGPISAFAKPKSGNLFIVASCSSGACAATPEAPIPAVPSIHGHYEAISTRRRGVPGSALNKCGIRTADVGPFHSHRNAAHFARVTLNDDGVSSVAVADSGSLAFAEFASNTTKDTCTVTVIGNGPSDQRPVRTMIRCRRANCYDFLECASGNCMQPPPSPPASPSPMPSPLPAPNMTCVPVFGTYGIIDVVGTPYGTATVVRGPNATTIGVKVQGSENTTYAPYDPVARRAEFDLLGNVTYSCFGPILATANVGNGTDSQKLFMECGDGDCATTSGAHASSCEDDLIGHYQVTTSATGGGGNDGGARSCDFREFTVKAQPTNFLATVVVDDEPAEIAAMWSGALVFALPSDPSTTCTIVKEVCSSKASSTPLEVLVRCDNNCFNRLKCDGGACASGGKPKHSPSSSPTPSDGSSPFYKSIYFIIGCSAGFVVLVGAAFVARSSKRSSEYRHANINIDNYEALDA